MHLTSMITLYLISIPLFFVVDLIWLGVVAKNFYQTRLDHLMGEVNWIAAGIFYAIYLVGLVIFATYPALQKENILLALGYGALFGFFTYATYDLTNLSTLRDWPLSVTIVDIMWGTVLGAVVSYSTIWIYTHLM